MIGKRLCYLQIDRLQFFSHFLFIPSNSGMQSFLHQYNYIFAIHTYIYVYICIYMYIYILQNL